MNQIKKGDRVVIVGSAEEEVYMGDIFEVLSEPYKVCGSELVKMKCHETGKYFSGGYSTEFLQKTIIGIDIASDANKTGGVQ